MVKKTKQSSSKKRSRQPKAAKTRLAASAVPAESDSSDIEEAQVISGTLSRSRAASPSHPRAASSSRSRANSPGSNRDFVSDSDQSSSASSHPLPSGEVPHPPNAEVQKTHPPREVPSPSHDSSSDDDDVQYLGQTASQAVDLGDKTPKPPPRAEGSARNLPGSTAEISQVHSPPRESVTNFQRVSTGTGQTPVNLPTTPRSPVSPQSSPRANAPTGLLPVTPAAQHGEQARREKNQKEVVPGPSDPTDATPAGMAKGQRHAEAAGAAEGKPKKHKSSRSKTSNSSAKADLAKLTDMVRTLQEQVTQQNTKLQKQAHQATLAEERLRELREREVYDEEKRAADQAEQIAQLQADLDEAKGSLNAPAKFQQLDDPEFSARFETLMKTGLYSLESVRAALEATKQEGKYSSTRADAYLKAILVAQRNEVLQRANQGVAEDLPSIQPGSALARLLGTFGNEDSVDIVVKLKDAHAKRKSSHSAAPAVAAGNLLQGAAVKNDSTMLRKGTAFLSQVAVAVCEDCDKCQELRSTAEAAERWRTTKADAAEQNKKKEESCGKKRAALTLPFKTADSRRDVRKPHTACAECKKGKTGGKWLYFCDDCNRGFHLLCVDWKHLRHPTGGATWFSCANCVTQRDRDVANGNDARDYREVAEEVEHGLAPVSAEASDSEYGRGTRVWRRLRPRDRSPKPSHPQ